MMVTMMGYMSVSNLVPIFRVLDIAYKIGSEIACEYEYSHFGRSLVLRVAEDRVQDFYNGLCNNIEFVYNNIKVNLGFERIYLSIPWRSV